MISVLVMSCDSYEDTWQPFFHLLNKYWNKRYPTYICTETKNCPYASTIKTQGSWTARVRQALEQIDSEYVIFMLDDFFIRDYVDSERIEAIREHFNDNTAVYNFEKCYSLPTIAYGLNGFKVRQNKTPYLNSCQPSIHNRLKLIERLQQDQTPWEWEMTIVESPYDFYINGEELIIDIGYYDHKPWSIKQGKWCREIIPFFEKEGIIVDYKKRGFYD